jgi:hypothetical protein
VQASLAKLLTQFQDVFAKSNDDLGCTNIIEHHIDVHGAKPIDRHRADSL